MDNSQAVQNRRVFTEFLLVFNFRIFSREIAMDNSQAVQNCRVFTIFFTLFYMRRFLVIFKHCALEQYF